jgi:hypothetical protein
MWDAQGLVSACPVGPNQVSASQFSPGIAISPWLFFDRKNATEIIGHSRWFSLSGFVSFRLAEPL